MINISNENIKLRKDGSIDTSFYMTCARDARSQQAHSISGNTFRSVSKLVGSISKSFRQPLDKNTDQLAQYSAE